MKKISLFIVLVISFVQSLMAQDKAFKKGDFSIGLGVGMAGYGTNYHEEYDALVWTGSAIVNQRQVLTKAGGAVSVIVPLTVEYGLTNWFGLGGRFGYSKYIANGDSTNNHIVPTVHSIDGDIMLNFHFIKSPHFDMPLCVTVGYSGFSYLTNDAAGDKAKDDGVNFGLALNPRIYFGDHVGMFFNLGYMGYKYPSVLFSNNSNSDLNSSNNETFWLKGSGINFGLGLICKF